jgi:hypothetical protein
LAGKPVAEGFYISSTIDNHFSTTIVYGELYNPSPEFQQVSFTFFLSDNALITNLTMTSKGENYQAERDRFYFRLKLVGQLV